PTVSVIRPDLPPEVDEILARALAKEPTDRFASAGEMAAALQAVVPKAGPYPPEHAPDAAGGAATVVIAGGLVPPPPRERKRIDELAPAPSQPPSGSDVTDGADTVVVSTGAAGYGGG